MALPLSSDDHEAWTLKVKNTFVEIEHPRPSAGQRCNSAPPKSPGCRQNADFSVEKQRPHLESDASTDAETASTICSESGSATPGHMLSPQQSPVAPELNPELSMTVLQPRRLNSNALLFQPKATKPKPVVDDLENSHFKNRFVEVLESVRTEIQNSPYVEHLDMTDCDGTWCYVVRPRHLGTKFACQTEELIDWLQEVFLKAAAYSNCIYLMGFAGGGYRAFTREAQGFSAMYGAMENSRNACWHVFKKGFCKHGPDCCKEHPSCQVPVRVLVESTSLNGCPKFVGAFKQEVADLSMAVIVALQSCGFAEKVEAFKDKGCQGWTIEVTPKEEAQPHKDFLRGHAQNVLLSATAGLSLVWAIGHAEQPFLSKKDGFVTMLGAVTGETVPCSDLFDKGCCTRRECRYAHPDCLMPLSFIIKEKTSSTVSPAMMQYLENWNLSTTPCWN